MILLPVVASIASRIKKQPCWSANISHVELSFEKPWKIPLCRFTTTGLLYQHDTVDLVNTSPISKTVFICSSKKVDPPNARWWRRWQVPLSKHQRDTSVALSSNIPVPRSSYHRFRFALQGCLLLPAKCGHQAHSYHSHQSEDRIKSVSPH